MALPQPRCCWSGPTLGAAKVPRGYGDSHQNSHRKSPGSDVQTAMVHGDAVGGGSHGQTLQQPCGQEPGPSPWEGAAWDPPVPFPSPSQHPAARLYFTTQPAAALPLLPTSEELGGKLESCLLVGWGSCLPRYQDPRLCASRSFSAGGRAGGIQRCLSMELAGPRLEGRRAPALQPDAEHPLCLCETRVWSHHPVCRRRHRTFVLQPMVPGHEMPRQQLCPLPSPWLAPEPCPVPGCARTGLMETLVPGDPGGEEGAEQSRAAHCEQISSQPPGPEREEGVKLHLFPLFKGKGQRRSAQVLAPAGRIWCLSPCPSALPRQGSVPVCSRAPRPSLGGLGPLCYGSPQDGTSPCIRDGWDTLPWSWEGTWGRTFLPSSYAGGCWGMGRLPWLLPSASSAQL